MDTYFGARSSLRRVDSRSIGSAPRMTVTSGTAFAVPDRLAKNTRLDAKSLVVVMKKAIAGPDLVARDQSTIIRG